MKKRIVCFGPGPKFKGGISNYNTSLAKAFDAAGYDVFIVSWTQQYPAIIPREFVDKSSKNDLLEGTNVQVSYHTNYNNPFTWSKTCQFIESLNPDLVIFQWSIAIQGLPLGWMARKLSRNANIEVIFDLHFVIQKEASGLDRNFTKYGISPAKTYIAHAYKTVDELKELFPKQALLVNETGVRSTDPAQKTVIKLFHPVYDLFKEDPQFDKEAFKKANGLREHVFLFFGFIRKYKGLHQVIPAFAELAKRRDDVSLIICGESFWKTLDNTKWSTRIKSTLFKWAKSIFLKSKEDESQYNPLEMIDTLGIRDKVMVYNEYVPNEKVHQYFQASDAILLFYEYATPSGVESLSYNFKLPILAASVGHFPETVVDGFNGYLAKEADIADMTRVMEHFIEHPIPGSNVEETTRHMSWAKYAEKVVGI